MNETGQEDGRGDEVSMNDQLVRQYEAIAYMARIIAEVSDLNANAHKEGPRNFSGVVGLRGEKTLALMEYLGDVMNDWNIVLDEDINHCANAFKGADLFRNRAIAEDKQDD